MPRILCTVFLLFFLSGYAAGAQDEPGGDDAGASSNVSEWALSGGYRFVDVSGSERSGEYEYHHDSLMFGGDARWIDLPHRLHLDGDLFNRKDYLGEIGYGYRDLLLFRWQNRTLFHNTENLTLPDLDPATLDIRDPEEEYGLRAGINTLLLRAKAPDFPAHLYLNGSLFDKEGTRQQRFLNGAGYFNNIVRGTESRDVDWRTKQYALGINSHLGLVEADLSHTEKRFDAGGDQVLFDAYGPAGFPPGSGSVRAAGEYPHDRITNFKGSSNTLKVHTSYTGKIVGSATLTSKEKENEHSGAKADYFFGSGALTWMPMTRLAFFFKYRRAKRDLDNPDTVIIADRTDPTNTYGDPAVRRSISSTTDTYSGTVRYRPASRVTLKAAYTFEDVNRDFIQAEWPIVQDVTRRSALTLSGEARMAKGLKVDAKYTHKEVDDPEYNIEPNRSNEGSLSATWNPVTQLNTRLGYSITKEERNDPASEDTDQLDNRDVRRDKVFGNVTWLMANNLSMTASYLYFRNKIEQDIEYHDPFGNPMVDRDVPLKDRAHSYSLSLQYDPLERMHLNAGITHTDTEGSFEPNSQDRLQPVSIASPAELKIRETIYTLAGEYEFRDRWTGGLEFQYSDFNDVLDNPNDDAVDGISRIVMLRVSKRW